MATPKINRHVTLFRLVGSKVKPQSARITNVDSATQLDLEIAGTTIANVTQWTGVGSTRANKWRGTA